MTYLMQTGPTSRRQSPMVRRYGRRRMVRAMRGFGDDTADCEAQANAHAAGILAKGQDLEANWHPTGYYTPDEMKTLVQAAIDVLNNASNVVEQAYADSPKRDFSGNPTAFATALDNARQDILDRFKDAQTYINAFTEANAKGISLVDSPGLRRWVIKCFYTADSAVTTATFVSCATPWWVGAMAAVAQAVDKLVGIAKLIGKAVVMAGQTVLKVPDTISTIITAAKWTLIIGGPLYLLYELTKGRRAP